MKWIVFLALILAIVIGYKFIPRSQSELEVTTSEIPRFMPFTARFEITTLGTKRMFTDSKYHNRSDDVFIESGDPGLIMVSKEGVTWQQFFDTLPAPMKVTPNCLYTGTGQKFCTNKTQTLRFILNGQDRPDILTRRIAPQDNLLISFD